ncbi:MAG: hypothetical protein LH630_10720 [Actinomycetia bacterium]|nr:hypothetical protein [Actinomycetes bacterium]
MTRYSNHVKLLSLLSKVQHELPRTAPRSESPSLVPKVHKLERRLATEVLQQIVADYQAGRTSNQLMGDYTLGKGTVLRVLHDAGVIKKR